MPDPDLQTAVRGRLLHFVDNPFDVDEADAWEYFADGMLVIRDGKIVDIGATSDLQENHANLADIVDYPDHCLIMPGFVDAHVHYAQTNMIASYGERLLDWLHRYTFPEELKFVDRAYADSVARFFLDELLRNGTTTAMVFATSHPHSVDALFEEAERRSLRMIAGKVLMDRNAPVELCDTPEDSYSDSKRLIGTWHRKPGTRLEYAITPRFAPTSTAEQLAVAGILKREHPDVAVQTHLSEARPELDWVKGLFPDSSGYLDVYDQHHLLSDRSVFAHCIHVTDHERARLAETQSAIAWCPTANLFLGSGLFDLEKATAAGINVALGTDVGAGTSFSMLQTMHEAYKVAQLQQQTLTALQAFYLATLGGAKALRRDDCIGSFAAGKDADFVVLDLHTTPLLANRMSHTTTLQEQLFALMMLGDDRAIHATWINGERAHTRAI